MVKIPTSEWERGFAAGWKAARVFPELEGEEFHTHGTRKGEVRKTARRAYEKPKRKPSAYNKRYAAEYRRLRKKHPRMSFAALSKKTHKALRRKR